MFRFFCPDSGTKQHYEIWQRCPEIRLELEMTLFCVEKQNANRP